MTVTERNKLSRDDMVSALVERDGTRCMHPDCDHELDFKAKNNKHEVTLDHWMPVSKAREIGWTEDEIWSLDNLSLMCKASNAKKGDLLPNADGTLPVKKTRSFKYRRDVRAQRPEVCTSCNSGRNLQEDEWCNSCGSGPMPLRYPKWRQMQPKDCDHDLFYCWVCTIDKPESRRSVLDTLLTGGEGYE